MSEKQGTNIQDVAFLTEDTREKLEELKRTLVDQNGNRGKEVSYYNGIIQYQDPELLPMAEAALINIFCEYGKEIKKEGILIINEEEFIKNVQTDFKNWESQFSLIIIHISDGTTVEQWEQILPTLEANSYAIKYLCVSADAAAVLQTNDHLYNVFFPRHIILNKPDEEWINKLLLKKLEVNFFEISNEFEEGIRVFISKAASEGQLRNINFVNDLYNKIYDTCPKREKNPNRRIRLTRRNIPGCREDSLVRTESAPSRVFGHSEDKEENVLFISMSTLNQLSMNMYQYKDAGEKTLQYAGISQLEPGTKQVLCQLATEKKKLHRIVIVESEATRQSEVVGIDTGFWENPEEMEGKVHSAVCFYKQRIIDYIKGNYDKPILTDISNIIEDYANWETHFPDHNLYSEEDLRTLFYDVPVIEQKDVKNAEIPFQENSLEEFMDIIRAIKGEDQKTINLYIDMQGGSRSAAQQINAILELLKDQNVNIKSKYAIPKFNAGKVSVIREVSDQYRAYDLVSAMIEFKSYGRGAGLEEYFSAEKDENTREVIRLINQISGAISLCNMDAFETALQDMEQLRQSVDSGRIQLNSEIRIVFEDIIDNYRELLGEDSNPFEVIRWCVARKYYQQAITIIESRMPKMLVETEYLYYNHEDKRNFCGQQTDVEAICKNILEKRKQTWKSVENYLFEEWCKKLKKQGNNLLNGMLLNQWKGKYKKNRCDGKFLINDEVSKVSFDYSVYQKKVTGNSKFLFFAVVSSQIKDIRNKVNHASAKLTEQIIKDALDAYIAIGDELHLSEEWKKNHKNIEERNTKKYTATVKKISKKNKNVMLDVKNYEKKGDCLLDLERSNTSLEEIQKMGNNDEKLVKVIKESATNWFAFLS